jgi:ubiquinone biosynthesis protein UbiJ
LQALVAKGLTATDAMWPTIRTASGWVHQAARLLDNPTGQPAEAVRAEYRALLHEEMVALDDDEVETLAAAVEILDRLIERLSQRAR